MATPTYENVKQTSADSKSRLTDWANEPSLQDFTTDFETAKQTQASQISKITSWKALLHVTGPEAPVKRKGRSSVQPKMVRRQAEWRYSALTEPFLGSNKLFKVSPVTHEDVDAARQNELLLNYQFRTKTNLVHFIDQLVRATVNDGTAIVRVGWERQTVKYMETVPTWAYYEIVTPEEADAFQQAFEARKADIRGFEASASPEVKAAIDYFLETNIPVIAQQVGIQEVESEKILVNHPTADIVLPENFYVDPSCEGNFDKALYVVNTYETSEYLLKKDIGKYKNLDQIDWKNSTIGADVDHVSSTPAGFSYSEQSKNKVVAYEYWGYYDIENNGRLEPIVATWVNNTLIRLERNPFPDGKFPFVIIPYMPVQNSVYGEPDAELIGDNQRIAGAVMRGAIDLMARSANAQTGIAKGALDHVNMNRFTNGDDYEYNPLEHPERVFHQHKYPEIPESVLTMMNIQNAEAEAISGAKSFSGGLSGEAYGDVAAGIRGVLDASSKREMAILRRLAKGVCLIGHKYISMNGVWLSSAEVIRVTNEEFVEVSLEDIQGNFDLEVDISTAEVDNAQANDLAYMVQTVGPKADPMITMKLLSKIAELKRMPELAFELRNWRPEPTPEEQEMMQLELEEMRMKVALLQSEVELNQAKARQALSDADMKDLDFVEQETGTKHARELDKQMAQARGNQNLAITNALVKPTKKDDNQPDIAAGIGFNALTDAQNGAQTAIDRDIMAASDPRYNLGSQYYDPTLDSTNPNNRI